MTSASNSQKDKLKQFKQNVADILKPGYDDSYLLRWLTARNFDLEQSEKMLRDHLKWRVLVKADEILTTWDPPPVLLTYYPGGLYGYAKDGSPIWIEPMGKADVKGIMASVKKSDLKKFKVWHCELIQKALHDQRIKLGRDVRMLIIFDLESFSKKHLWKPALDFYTESFIMYEVNYPETLDIMYVINAPGIFPMAYRLVKHFLSPETKKKIRLFGVGSWKHELLKVIDADQLPVHWGGTATDPDGDPFCRSKIGIGGKVDPKFYIPENYSCVDRDAFTKVTVGRRASLKLPFQVTDPGSLLRWQFITEGSDIGFGIFYKKKLDDDGDKTKWNETKWKEEVVVPPGRLNSHMVPEDGIVSCQKPGLYTVTFDNTYSWLHSKKLLYQIDLLRPADEIDELTKSASFSSVLLDESSKAFLSRRDSRSSGDLSISHESRPAL